MTGLSLIACWALATTVSIPLLLFTLEVLCGVRKGSIRDQAANAPSTCIIIPAHNEASIIKATLEKLREELTESFRVLVVADNCTDHTADLVKEGGVEVIERFDEKLKGKGYALAYACNWLRQSPPECVIVFDADCTTDLVSLTSLAHCAVASRSAAQAQYIFEPDLSVSAKVQISNFALWLKNSVRQRGSRRLGGGAILTGTGMAFPWEDFAELPLATASIVEDLALTVHLARSGRAPTYLHEATVKSFAASESATLEQRARWEQGFLSVAKEHGLPLIYLGFKRLDRRVLLLGLHLLVPPLALLLTAALSTAFVLLAAAIWANHWLPLLAVTIAFSAAVLSAAFAWLAGGHHWMRADAVLFLPLYVVWKLPLYLRSVLGRSVGWVRTKRDSSS